MKWTNWNSSTWSANNTKLSLLTIFFIRMEANIILHAIKMQIHSSCGIEPTGFIAQKLFEHSTNECWNWHQTVSTSNHKQALICWIKRTQYDSLWKQFPWERFYRIYSSMSINSTVILMNAHLVSARCTSNAIKKCSSAAYFWNISCEHSITLIRIE